MDNDTHIQQEINKYKKFKKVDGATYRKVNQFLRKRTYITAREWALARLCTDFRTSGGAEMTFIGRHLPELVPFMEDTYTPQAVNQARNSFKKKVRKASATFFYGAMCGFFTTDELDDLLFEASEVARFLLEVEGTTLDIDEEIDIEDRITLVMRGVGEAAKTLLKARGEDNEKHGHPDQEKNDMGAGPVILETDLTEPILTKTDGHTEPTDKSRITNGIYIVQKTKPFTTDNKPSKNPPTTLSDKYSHPEQTKPQTPHELSVSEPPPPAADRGKNGEKNTSQFTPYDTGNNGDTVS